MNMNMDTTKGDEMDKGEILVTVYGFGAPHKCSVPVGTTTAQLTGYYFSGWWDSGSQMLLNGKPLDDHHIFTQDSHLTVRRAPWFSWLRDYKGTLKSGVKLVACLTLWLAPNSLSCRQEAVAFGVGMWMMDHYVQSFIDTRRTCCCQQLPPPAYLPTPQLAARGQPTATPQPPNH
eukprot:TRINITY_DN57496_c0_g4_i1.p1 TRINITY_DN57496_c0_g4~~TRINITY_DN57496_c0_g4_i1.p1  ORF type:complete len:175 (-),score=12.84 TRINITY_DN57496_c0_g4_i1:90-614(-)